MPDKLKRYIIRVAGMDNICADAYIDCGSVLEAVSIKENGTFVHYSIPSHQAVVVDHNPKLPLDEFLEEERLAEERIGNVRKAKKQIQNIADKNLEELPAKISAQSAPPDDTTAEDIVEGYR